MALASFTPDDLKNSLFDLVNKTANKEQINLISKVCSEAFHELIEKLSYKHKSKIVVLIDEYDTAIMPYVNDHEMFKSYSNILQPFYYKLKDSDASIKLTMVTGVSRTGLMLQSSGPNNLTDITYDNDYSVICGFTYDELDHYFADRYQDALKKFTSRIKYHITGIFKTVHFKLV
jgi:hypothetical protein